MFIKVDHKKDSCELSFFYPKSFLYFDILKVQIHSKRKRGN
jgi:hypothetical protein